MTKPAAKPSSPAIKVPCPTCAVVAGSYCHKPTGEIQIISHRERQIKGYARARQLKRAKDTRENSATARANRLHYALDELTAEFLTENKNEFPSTTTILRLMTWSATRLTKKVSK